MSSTVVGVVGCPATSVSSRRADEMAHRTCVQTTARSDAIIVHFASIPVSAEQRNAIDEALGVVKDEALREPEPSALHMLEALREQRVPVGVLSNCHAREVRCWAESPLDPLTDVFGRSCHIGAMKPDPATYAWVLERLEVSAGDATYVGNGSSDELVGARAAGFARVIHCNVFDRRADQVSVAEQQHRASTADVSADTIEQLRAVLLGEPVSAAP